MDGKILIAGCGFLGSWFSRFYAQRASSLQLRQEVFCLDNDVFEMRNTPTQYLDQSLVGVEKAMVACDTFGRFGIDSTPVIQRLTSANINEFMELWSPLSLVVDSFDNYESRVLCWYIAKDLGIECLHLSISPSHFGRVDWNKSWPLDPGRVMTEVKKEEVETPPCELVLYQQLGIQVALRGAVETVNYLLGYSRRAWIISEIEQTCVYHGQT